jgi:hypothetical protein
MNKLAISLCVLGFVTVNAASSTTTTSGSFSGIPAATAGQAMAAAAPLLAGGDQPWSSSTAGLHACVDNGRASGDWWHDEAGCEDLSNDDCENRIHIGRAGMGASGSAVSQSVLVSQGEVVIPAQVYVTTAECTETNSSNQEGSSNKTVASVETFSATGAITRQRYDAYQSCNEETDEFALAGSGSAAYSQEDM